MTFFCTISYNIGLMALTGEHVQVDGRKFRILSFDVEQINANKNEGAPHIWHGVEVVSGDQQAESGLFASSTVRYPPESRRRGQIKAVSTHKIG